MSHVHESAMGSSGAALGLTLTLIFIALVYSRGWLRLRLSLNGIAGWRAASFLSGLSLIWIAGASPVAALDEQLLTVHMIQHLLLMTIAPPLIWLGAPVLPMLHGLPGRTRTVILQVFGWAPLRHLGMAITRPVFCWTAAAAALIGWHIPAAFALGMQSSTWHLIEHATFLATGLLFWWPVIQPWPSAFRQPGLSIIVYLLLATFPCDILSGFLVFCDRVVYKSYLYSPRMFELSVLADQECAGALMWSCVTIVYLVAAAILTTKLLSPQLSPQRFSEEPSVKSEWRESAVSSEPESAEVV